MSAKRTIAQIFDQPGPQLTPKRFGPEPTLREVLTSYYTTHGFGVGEARKLAARYIAKATQP